VDTQELASSTTALIAPMLSQLLRGDAAPATEGMAPGATGPSATDAALAQAREVWELLRPLAAVQPLFERAAQDLAGSPDDPDAQAAFRLQLKKLLLSEPESAARLGPLIGQISTVNTEGGAAVSGNVEAGNDFVGRDKVTRVKARGRGVAVGGDAGGIIITGDNGPINIHTPKPD
jgi:hypothetical protein